MQAFIDYLKKENVIPDLKLVYKVDKNNQYYYLFLDRIIEHLNLLNNSILTERNIKNSILEYMNFDLISRLYENTRNHEEKKKLGEFYTPISIVSYILDAVGYSKENFIEDKKIIDISCGSGSFIVQAVSRLVERWKKKLNIEKLSELSANDAKRIIESIQDNVIGLDVNPIAVILCQVNIQLNLFKLFNLIRKSEKNYNFPKFKIFNDSALEFSILEEYDFVVGNPPYLFIRDIPQEQRNIINQKNLETNIGQYDYYQIFMELGIKLLKNQGNFGYIVPDSLLALSNRKVIRKYIYENVKIKELYNIGPKFDDQIVSNMIVILQKEKNIIERENNQILIKIANPKGINQGSIIQKQIKDWDYDFLIHLSKEDILILGHLNSTFPKLGELMNEESYKISLSRGVELGKDGKVIYCTKCDNYLPLPKNELRCSQCNIKLSKNSIENIIHKRIPSKKKKIFSNIFTQLSNIKSKNIDILIFLKKELITKILKSIGTEL